jgi:hypothetical protein
MATTKKNPIIGPATRAKVTSVVRKVQNSKAAGAVKKAGAAVKQEARVIGRAVTGYKAKKEQSSAAASPASAFQVNSEVFGKGKIKSPSQIREEKKQERSDRRVANRMSRSADRSKRIGDGERAYTLSPGSERYQSSKEGLIMYKDGVPIPLPKSRRKAVRIINENLRTKLEGRERNKLAKEYYENIKSKPTTDAEKRKRDNKLQRGKQAATTGGGTNACREDVMGTTGGKKGTNCKPKK